MSNKLKYGVVYGYGEPMYSVAGPFVASDVLSAKSGRYVVYDISDTYFRAVNDGENKITGYVDQNLTCGASGVTVLPVALNVSSFATEMPYSLNGAAATLAASVLATLYGKLIDIYVDSSNIQYADNRTTVADSILRVIGGSVENNSLYVVVVDSAINQIS